MRFLANENFAGPSVDWLRDRGVDIQWIAKTSPGISDQKVMAQAVAEQRTILTHDSDYGQLIFKHGYRPPEGVVYFRLSNFEPEEPAKILLDLIDTGHDFIKRLTVIDANSIRERKY